VGLPEREEVQEVIYLSLNAANAGLEKQVGSREFLSRLRPCVTLIKSASYLLFGPDFSEMRKLILTQSVGILQEDSGIPYRYFDTTAWRVQLYGVYHKPIPLFQRKYQPDLWQAYRSLPVGHLPFGIGYHIFPGQSNLLWAVRRNPTAALPPLPEEISSSLSLPSLPPNFPRDSVSAALRETLSSLPSLSPMPPLPNEAPSADSE
ncbi:MAG: hypothetical protein RMJ66_04840, partial [Bacteroidia bacterium]|nr:hypothetical protein [Bacteroidia bacterium]MDW8134374.1 hypothetical protein [Bacteroidia bacterium]